VGNTILITSKYQMHIPLEMRKKLGIQKATKALVEVLDNTLIIKPIKESPFLSLAGKYKDKKKIPAEKIRDYIDYSNI